MNGYRWTTRVGLGGLGFLTLLAAFVVVTRVFDLVVGVQPEAWVLTAMMTASITVGAVSLFTVAAVLIGTWFSRRRSEGSPSLPAVSTA